VAYAATDNTNVLIPPPAPIGPAYWTSSLIPPAPSILGLYGTRPFALTSGDQFRPPPTRRSGPPSSSPRWRRSVSSRTPARRPSLRSRSSGRSADPPT